jgi:hypothetical protein
MRGKLIRLLIVLMAGVVFAPLHAAAAQPPQLGEARHDAGIFGHTWPEGVV